MKSREFIDPSAVISLKGVNAPVQKPHQGETPRSTNPVNLGYDQPGTWPVQRFDRPEADPQGSAQVEGCDTVVKIQNLRVEFKVKQRGQPVKVAVNNLNLSVRNLTVSSKLFDRLPANLQRIHTAFQPTGPKTTEVRVDWIVSSDAEEGRDYDVDQVIALWDITNRQDWKLCCSPESSVMN